MLKLAAAIVLAGCALQVHAAFTGDAIVVTEAQANSAVTLAPGQDLVVRLASNPSTGYSWSLRPNAKGVLAARGEPVFERADNAPGMAGVPGTEVWRISASAAGEQVLVFEYRRPWETGQPPARILSFPVSIRAAECPALSLGSFATPPCPPTPNPVPPPTSPSRRP